MAGNPDLERLQALLESNPEEAARLLRRVQEKVVVPHPGQVPVLNSRARFKVLDAGRRWGKTKLGAKVCVQEARKSHKMVWWVAPTYKVVKRGYREVLRQLPRELLTHEPPQDSAFDAGRSVILRLKNGARIEFYSAERPEGMLGEGVDFALVDEAAVIPKGVWDQIIRPTLMDRAGGGMLISTPRGHNWFYEAWMMGQSNDPDTHEWESWMFPTWTNPYIAEGEIEEMRRTLPSVTFQQEVEAKFLSDAASVFRPTPKTFQEACKPAGQHVYLGVDLAKSVDYTVLLGAREKDRMPVYYERLQAVSWPEQKRRIAQAVRTIRKRGAPGVTLVVDSTGLGDPIADDLMEAGFDVIPVKFSPQWKQQAVTLLGSDIETEHAFLPPEAKHEFQVYQYKHNPDNGRISYSAPEGHHDDIVSAALLMHWGLVQEGSPDVVSIGSITEDESLSEFGYDPDETFEDEVGSFEAMLEADEPGTVVTHQIVRPRSTHDLMNDAAAWS